MKQWLEKWKKSREALHLQTGKWGERQAARFLKRLRYRIRDQRARVGKHDELDIVAEHSGILVFVEVKTRRNENYGRPFAAVNKAKRKHLSRAAVTYLKKNKLRPDHIRFDVVEVIGEPAASRRRSAISKTPFRWTAPIGSGGSSLRSRKKQSDIS